MRKFAFSLSREKRDFTFSLVMLTYGTLQGHAHLPLVSLLCALNTRSIAGLQPRAGSTPSIIISFFAFVVCRYLQHLDLETSQLLFLDFL